MAEAASLDQVVARVGRPLLIEAVRMLEAGEGTVVGIDAALASVGYPEPFRRLDEVGLDVDLAIDMGLSAEFEMSTRFEPPPLQRALVQAGRRGRDTGRGFYRYRIGAAPVPDQATEAGDELSSAAIIERLQLGIVNEAYRVVEEGLAAPAYIDEVMRAEGHPLGPFELVDELGLRRIVEGLRVTYPLTAERSGDQYLVAAALWQLATV